MATRRLGIIMNGVTGRMGLNQHLVRSIVAIRRARRCGARQRRPRHARPDPGRPQCRQGGGDRAAIRRRALDHRSVGRAGQRGRHRVLRFRHHADAHRPADAGDRGRQAHLLREAGRRQPRQGAGRGAARQQARHQARRRAGQAVPARACASSGCCASAGFFGRIFAVRGEFGYWVFEGDWGQPAQRPSWNYKKAEGGGIILDMLCHWRYVLDNLFGAGAPR